MKNKTEKLWKQLNSSEFRKVGTFHYSFLRMSSLVFRPLDYIINIIWTQFPSCSHVQGGCLQCWLCNHLDSISRNIEGFGDGLREDLFWNITTIHFSTTSTVHLSFSPGHFRRSLWNRKNSALFTAFQHVYLRLYLKTRVGDSVNSTCELSVFTAAVISCYWLQPQIKQLLPGTISLTLLFVYTECERFNCSYCIKTSL